MAYPIDTVVRVLDGHALEGCIARICRVNRYTYWIRVWNVPGYPEYGAFTAPVQHDYVERASGNAPACR